MTELEQFKKHKVDRMEASCRSRGLPVTIQRRVIMESLAGRCDHPTADQVYEEVRARISGVSRTTVYRVLENFVSQGVAQKVSVAQAKARFDAQTDRHHHVECLNCGAVVDVQGRDLAEVVLDREAAGGFEVVDYSISFRGTCWDCLARGDNRSKEEE